jgi:regulator of cell morphogenesis and NO signaling
MENIETLTLGEIVKQNYKAAAILEKFSLDFCCMGEQNLLDACKVSNLAPSLVIHELQQIQNERNEENDFNAWPLDLLVDYICERHHTYVEQKTPLLNGYLDKITEVHGANHPELREIKKIFLEIGGELTVHMKKEEFILFPFIKKLERAKGTKLTVSSPLFGMVSNPVNMMKGDHLVEGEKFKRIAALTNNYQLPADACNTYALTYQLLKEYEKDLHLHIHLENNILFPKAIELEKEISVSGFF